MSTAVAEAQTGFNFTFTFLIGAASLTKLSQSIEEKGKNCTEHELLQHRSFVAGAIMQAVAALESDAWSLLYHGPGHHLGSDGVDKNAKDLLSLIADTVEKESLLDKYDLILRLTRRKKLEFGIQPMQDLKLVVGLRNELTHFKSLWTNELERRKLFKTLEEKDSIPPSFKPEGFQNFFPHVCLTYRRAGWALNTVLQFIEYYYKELGIKSPIDGQNMSLITV